MNEDDNWKTCVLVYSVDNLHYLIKPLNIFLPYDDYGPFTLSLEAGGLEVEFHFTLWSSTYGGDRKVSLVAGQSGYPKIHPKSSGEVYIII